MVHSGPPSRQSSPLIDASMRPPLRSSRPAATSRRSALGIAAALACILVVLLRGQQQNVGLQRPQLDTEPQQNPFELREQQRGEPHAEQQAAGRSGGSTVQHPTSSRHQQVQPEAASGEQLHSAEAMRGVKPPKIPAAGLAKPVQQQAAEQQPAAAAQQQAAAGSNAAAAEKPEQQQQQEQQQEQQQQDNAGQGGSEEGGEGGSGSQEEGPTGGWSDSFIKSKADGRLGHLLDVNSMMSPLRTCAADGFSLEMQEREAEDLLADVVEGRPALSEAQERWARYAVHEPALVSGTAHNLACSARRNGGTCCSHPVSFRRNTTDYRVFKQVFQCHYMRYLYTLFGDQPPKYILDAGANAGFSTILFKLLWPEATVVMLEPDPSNFAMLSRNTATLKDVHPINAGLWGRTANITVKASHGNWGKVFQEAEEGQPGMPAYSVEDVARKAGIPAFDFVKIDIEGAEGQVFAPGRDVSWIKQARAVSLELHDFFADYFGLKRGEVSARVDAAFSPTGFTPVSDNEHIIYLNQELQAAVSQLREPLPKLIAIREGRLKKVSGC